MARSAKGHQDELDDEDLFTENTSSSLNKEKVDEPTKGKRVNPHRSKHSETEQRRRIKINERFQVLKDLIPQNDQKRDKASLLLEVIQYIQFLQEKVQIYEQSHEGWNQEPTKLIPWRNHHGPAEHTTDPSQAIQNGSVIEKNNDVSSLLPGSVIEKNNDVSSLLPQNVQNPIDSGFSTTTIQKGLTPCSATGNVPMAKQMRLDMFDPVVNSGLVTQQVPGPLSNAGIPSHTEPQVWLSKPNKDNYIVPDNTLKEQEELTIDSGSDSISNAYSQRILDTLTQALQCSGVDLSQASVSVQIDVGRRSNNGLNPSTYSSKGHENQFLNNQAMAYSGGDYCSEDSEQSQKRLRREAS